MLINLETTFSTGAWSAFFNSSKVFLIYIVLHTFSHLLLAVYDALLKRAQESSSLTSEIN